MSNFIRQGRSSKGRVILESERLRALRIWTIQRTHIHMWMSREWLWVSDLSFGLERERCYVDPVPVVTHLEIQVGEGGASQLFKNHAMLQWLRERPCCRPATLLHWKRTGVFYLTGLAGRSWASWSSNFLGGISAMLTLYNFLHIITIPRENYSSLPNRILTLIWYQCSSVHFSAVHLLCGPLILTWVV